MNLLLTVKQVAAKLQLSHDTLRKMRRAGTGPRWIRLGHRTIRYPEDGVRNYALEIVNKASWDIETAERHGHYVENPTHRTVDDDRHASAKALSDSVDAMGFGFVISGQQVDWGPAGEDDDENDDDEFDPLEEIRAKLESLQSQIDELK